MLVTLTLVGFLSSGAQGGEDGGRFEDLSREAAAAREARHRDEALRLYREALGENPSWDEGWWYVGTLSYDGGACAEAQDALDRFLSLKPEAGAAWALEGLCDFRLAKFDRSLERLRKGLAYGLGPNEKLTDAVLFHLALLLVRAGEFDLANEALRAVVKRQEESPQLDTAIGLLVLSMPILPRDVPPDQADLVEKAGHAGYLALSRHLKEAADLFRALLERFPGTPHLHEAYGRAILPEDPDGALSQFRRETELHPDGALAHFLIAAELLRRREPAGAVEAAESAVRLDPKMAQAHRVLGDALVETGSIERGVRELEAAVALDPESAEGHYVLARGYVRAGRREDAERARARFSELDSERRALEAARAR